MQAMPDGDATNSEQAPVRTDAGRPPRDRADWLLPLGLWALALLVIGGAFLLPGEAPTSATASAPTAAAASPAAARAQEKLNPRAPRQLLRLEKILQEIERARPALLAGLAHEAPAKEPPTSPAEFELRLESVLVHLERQLDALENEAESSPPRSERIPAVAQTARVGEPGLDARLDRLRAGVLRLRELRPGGAEPGWVGSGAPVLPSKPQDFAGRAADRLGQELMLLEEALARFTGAAKGLLLPDEAAGDFVLAGPRQVYSVELPEDRPPSNLALVFDNVGAAAVRAPWVTHAEGPDWFDLSSILQQGTAGAVTQAEQIHALWRFLVESRYHGDPPTDGPDLHDPVRFLNVYGYGYCDDAATVMAHLGLELGVPARVWWLSGHVVPEFWLEERWSMYDPDGEAWFPAPDGRAPASVEELARDATLFEAPIELEGRRRGPWPLTLDFYASTEDNVASPPRSPGGFFEMGVTLEPGDRFLLGFQHQGWRYANNRYAPPARFGNGLLQARRRVAAESVEDGELAFELPYAFLAGRARASAAPRPPDWTASLHAGAGESPLEWIDDGQGGWALPLTDGIPLGMGHPVYALRLLLAPGPAAEAELELDVELVFQVAPRALPALRPGRNELTFRSDSPDLPLRVRHFAGVEP